MKTDLNFFGMKRPGGSSEAEGKRRAVTPGSAEWLKMDRPKSKVKILGFISFSQGSKSGFPVTR